MDWRDGLIAKLAQVATPPIVPAPATQPEVGTTDNSSTSDSSSSQNTSGPDTLERQQLEYAGKLEGAIRQFHEFWYLAKNGPEWYVPKEKVAEWHQQALVFGIRSLKNLQNHVSAWFEDHNYNDPVTMWTSRLEQEITELEARNEKAVEEGDDERIMRLPQYIFYLKNKGYFKPQYIKDYQGNYHEVYDQLNRLLDGINDSNVERLLRQSGIAMDIHSFQKLMEDGMYEPDEEQPEPEEWDEERAAEELREYIPYTEEGAEGFFNKFDIDILRDPAFNKVMLDIMLENHDHVLDTWEKWKQRRRWKATPMPVQQIVDLVGAQVERNNAALASNDLNQIAEAVSLTLNLKHNFGNLIVDHIRLSQEFLNEMSNMDTSRLDEMLRQNGFNPQQAWGDNVERNKATMDMQHPYYQQKEVERQQHFEEQGVPADYRRPWTGAGFDWRDRLVANKKWR